MDRCLGMEWLRSFVSYWVELLGLYWLFFLYWFLFWRRWKCWLGHQFIIIHRNSL